MAYSKYGNNQKRLDYTLKLIDFTESRDAKG